MVSNTKHMNCIPITNHKSGTYDDLRITIYPDEYGFGNTRQLISDPETQLMPFTEATQRLVYEHEKATVELVRDTETVMCGALKFNSASNRVTPVFFIYPWYMEDETPEKFTLELEPSAREPHQIGVAAVPEGGMTLRIPRIVVLAA